MVGQLHDLHELCLRVAAADDQAFVGQLLLISAVELVAVAVALGDLLVLVGLHGLRARLEDAAVGAQAHGAAHVHDIALLGHEINDGIGCGQVELAAVRLIGPHRMSRQLDHHDLQS